MCAIYLRTEIIIDIIGDIVNSWSNFNANIFRKGLGSTKKQ